MGDTNMKSYMMYPELYVNRSFIPSNTFQEVLPFEHFASLEDAINFAKQTHVCLREKNWYVYECSFFSKNRLSLGQLYRLGYFSIRVSEDNISIYYNWKE